MTNRFWLEVFPNGRVYSSGSFPDAVTPTPLQGGSMVEVDRLFEVNRIAFYDGQVLQVGLPPSENHKFNYAAREWRDPRTLADLKAAKWQAIKAAGRNAEQGPFNYNTMRFDGDIESMRSLSALIAESKAAIAAGSAFTADYILANDTIVALTAADFVAIEKAKNKDVAGVNAKAVRLRRQIRAATTKEELQAINWGNA